MIVSFSIDDLTTETLTMMTLCLMPNLQGFKRLGAPRAAVECNPTDLIEFISKNFIPLNTMMERAGMSEMDIYHRTCIQWRQSDGSHLSISKQMPMLTWSLAGRFRFLQRISWWE